jgi:hypothetical protein
LVFGLWYLFLNIKPESADRPENERPKAKGSSTIFTILVRLKFFAGFETNCFAGWDSDFFASPWVAADAPLSGLDDKNSKTSQLNSLAPGKCFLHRMEKCLNSLFGLHFWNTCFVGNAIDNV